MSKTQDGPRAGEGTDAIDTPALVIDLDAMERNLRRMADFAVKHGVRWRAHAKAHKCAALAQMQIAAGAAGICVQKTAEAEAMAEGGVRDIYLTNEVVAASKLARVARLAKRLAAMGGRLGIAVDSPAGIDRLAMALLEAGAEPGVIDVCIEVDVGQRRCGVLPGTDAVPLARAIGHHRAMRFAGLQAYHGRAQHLRGAAERQAAIAGAARFVRDTVAALDAAGIAVPLVTGSGTGTLVCEAASGVWGELQPGSFLFMDADYGANERDPAQPAFEHALFLKTQVVSACGTHAVCDAGHKSHAVDSGMPWVVTSDAAHALVYANGGDEHGILRCAPGATELPQVGQMLWLVPGHVDPTVNLHDRMIGVRGGLTQGVVDRVFTVDARGATT